jgi:flagellar FliL protein
MNFRRIQLKIDTILLYTVFVLLGAIVLGTILAFVLRKAAPGALLRRPEPIPREATQNTAAQNGQTKTVAYTELGQIRVFAKSQNDSESPIVLVSPWFTYPPGDTAFYEELSAKNRKLKLLFSDYFSRHTMQELISKGEAAVKSDLVNLVNDELVLGKLSDLYFDEYLFFD